MVKNIVFDMGNVLVRWEPKNVVIQLFPEYPDPDDLTHKIFKEKVWYDLNKGKITEPQAILEYHQSLNISIEKLQILMDEIKKSLIPIEGSIELAKKLYSHYPLYLLTDNTHEIFAYLMKKYNFGDFFRGAAMSADIGYLKPSPMIYNHLLEKFNLTAKETLFMDDILINVEGAKAVGIQAFQFKNIDQCIQELRLLKIEI